MAVHQEDVGAFVQAAHGGQPAQAAAVHVGLGVVDLARAGEQRLQESAFDPAVAAVAKNILVVGKFLGAAVVVKSLKLVGIQRDVLPVHVLGKHTAVADQGFGGPDGVAGAVG